jgi:hypothetical protein
MAQRCTTDLVACRGACVGAQHLRGEPGGERGARSAEFCIILHNEVRVCGSVASGNEWRAPAHALVELGLGPVPALRAAAAPREAVGVELTRPL